MKQILLYFILIIFITGCSTSETIRVPVSKARTINNEIDVVKVSFQNTNYFKWKGTQKINLALLDFISSKSLSDFSDNLYTFLSSQNEVLNKFVIFPYKSIKAQKDMLGLSDFNAYDKTVQEKLKNELEVDIILWGYNYSEKGITRFTLYAKDLSSGETINEVEFKNSYNSSCLEDFKTFLTLGKRPVYSSEKVVSNTSEIPYNDYETQEVKKINWGGTLVLAMVIGSAIYALAGGGK